MDKMIIDYPLEVQRGVFRQSGAVFLAIYFLPKKTMKAVRTPAFVVLQDINLNMEIVLSLVFSLFFSSRCFRTNARDTARGRRPDRLTNANQKGDGDIQGIDHPYSITNGVN